MTFTVTTAAAHHFHFLSLMQNNRAMTLATAFNHGHPSSIRILHDMSCEKGSLGPYNLVKQTFLTAFEIYKVPKPQ
jgi:hypothetical protein